MVNDLGGNNAGEGEDSAPAHSVVAEVIAAGGRAIANTDNATGIARKALCNTLSTSLADSMYWSITRASYVTRSSPV